LKTRKYHIFCSWLLLICFVMGQGMVYAHQHRRTFGKPNAVKNLSRQAVTEKCSLCNVMHHNAMVAAAFGYTGPVASVTYIFNKLSCCFTTIPLILSSGRAPPAADYSNQA